MSLLRKEGAVQKGTHREMPILPFQAVSFTRAGFLIMRYTEQLKYSRSYNWGIFREIWDIFTLHNCHWLVVGLLVVLCIAPSVGNGINPIASYYLNNALPPFNPAPLQDIVPDYYWIARGPPPILLLFNYFWVMSSGFTPLTNTLCLMSVGLLLVAYVRQEEEKINWWNLIYLPFALLCMARIKWAKRKRNSMRGVE